MTILSEEYIEDKNINFTVNLYTYNGYNRVYIEFNFVDAETEESIYNRTLCFYAVIKDRKLVPCVEIATYPVNENYTEFCESKIQKDVHGVFYYGFATLGMMHHLDSAFYDITKARYIINGEEKSYNEYHQI